ncbi:hypothetical protein DPM19_19025 [Actinomadura craniellae]|uniref:GP-PDE domain-containing protein n=1 Tax=Actinomadura craniellae TaxID=2231787 RepID=A0A365H409_9ACTN|nr:hypothetical protein DPM19_19025 [Actinomadura craniellae]
MHAHNDYQNGDPLDDALENGATSVEADVWLEDGRLRLKHDKDEPGRYNDLREEYFEPLIERAARNGGQIYPGRGQKFEIFIEVKGGGGAAYEKIAQDIAGPPPLPADVQVVIPVPPNFNPDMNTIGNTPTPPNITFSTGFGPDCTFPPPRLDPQNQDVDPETGQRVYHPKTAERITVLNGEFDKCMDTDKGRKLYLSQGEHERFRALVQQVHNSNRKVRIWGGPDGDWRTGYGKFIDCPKLPTRDQCEGGIRKNWWQAARDAGVDYLVTNHLAQGAEWLRSCSKK